MKALLTIIFLFIATIAFEACITSGYERDTEAKSYQSSDWYRHRFNFYPGQNGIRYSKEVVRKGEPELRSEIRNKDIPLD